ncbi:acetolactate synthase [Fusarium mexicanum]|uniref:Acetolactate synthase n=1 Tax=Fusarium mexicanum TaxID=751941 RepID=A0A8H5JBQ1_9HYPO|nr:acetolactate synthase [Fusarium mexicanum]
MSVVQDLVINRFGRPIIVDSEISLCWTANYLKFYKHGHYLSNLDSSPLGHAVCGVVGMGLGGNHAVAIVSDAAMLKQSKVSTAVRYESKAIWLVMNSSQYGTVDPWTRTWGDVPPPYSVPYTDFEVLAGAVLCKASTVTGENGLRTALGEALVRDGPTVINVLIGSPPVAPLEPEEKSSSVMPR